MGLQKLNPELCNRKKTGDPLAHTLSQRQDGSGTAFPKVSETWLALERG